MQKLEERELIRTERTTVTLKDGRKRNGTLLYTILPTEQAVEQHNRHQLYLVETAIERHRVQQKLAAQTEAPPLICSGFRICILPTFCTLGVIQSSVGLRRIRRSFTRRRTD